MVRFKISFSVDETHFLFCVSRQSLLSSFLRGNNILSTIQASTGTHTHIFHPVLASAVGSFSLVVFSLLDRDTFVGVIVNPRAKCHIYHPYPGRHEHKKYTPSTLTSTSSHSHKIHAYSLVCSDELHIIIFFCHPQWSYSLPTVRKSRSFNNTDRT